MANNEDLARRLSLGTVVSISISSMLGSGIFVLPGVAISLSGPSLWLAYLIAAICVLPAALSKAELGTAMPTSGGTYVYIERTFGPLVGMIGGLGLWLALLLKSAFALIGIGAYLAVVTTLPLKVMAISILAAIIVLNIAGIGKVGGAVIAIVIMSLLGLTGLGVLGLQEFSFDKMVPMFPNGIDGLLAASGLVFVSYAGVTKVAAIAEEVKKPERNLPRGIIISLLVVTVFYCGMSFILVGNIPYELLRNDYKPIYTFALKVGGSNIAYLAAIVAVLTMASMANSGILAASRFPFAMSRDALLPSFVGVINNRFKTPIYSIAMSGIIVAGIVCFVQAEGIAKFASAFILLIYVVENIVVIILRETRVQWYQPKFKAPFYPFLQIFGVVSGLVLLVGMGTVSILSIASVTAVGTVLYFVYARPRTSRRGVVGIRMNRSDLNRGDEEINDDTEVIENMRSILPSDAKVIVALFGNERSPEVLIEMGLALSGSDKFVEVVHLTEVPEQTDLSNFYGYENSSIRSLRRRLVAMQEEKSASIHFDPMVAHDIYNIVYEISNRLHSQWLVKEWGGRTSGTFTLHKQMGWLEDHLNCNIITFRDAGVRYIRKILVLVHMESIDDLLLDTAGHFADIFGARLTFMVYLDKTSSDADKDSAKSHMLGLTKICTQSSTYKIITGSDYVKSVIRETAEYDLLLMNSKKPKKGRNIRGHYFGSDQDKITSAAGCSVVKIKEVVSTGVIKDI